MTGHDTRRHYSVETDGRNFRVVVQKQDQREGSYWEPVDAFTYSTKDEAWRRADALEASRPQPWRPAER